MQVGRHESYSKTGQAIDIKFRLTSTRSHATTGGYKAMRRPPSSIHEYVNDIEYASKDDDPFKMFEHRIDDKRKCTPFYKAIGREGRLKNDKIKSRINGGGFLRENEV